jgi:glutamyl-tRNA synthetase
MRVRFAPSPTGKLHLGNARMAVANWLHARAQGGEFMLRMDDTDEERSTEAFAEGIKEDMTWLGLDWDCFARQSDRYDRYEIAKQKLIDDGRLYPCYESPEELGLMRKSLLQRGQPPIYDRSALKLTDEQKERFAADGRQPHWRFKLLPGAIEWEDMARGPVHFEAENIADPVLLREDGRPLYTLSSVVDDIELEMTDVIRGEDHVTNTAAQVQLFEALDGTVPRFAHISLVLDAEGTKLSKRTADAMSLEGLREESIEPLAIITYLSKLGTSEAPQAELDLQKIIADFEVGGFGRAAPRMSVDELKHLNTALLHISPFERVKDRLDCDEDFWLAFRENIDSLEGISLWQRVVGGEIDPVIDDADFAKQAADLLPEGDVEDGTWKAWTGAVKDSTGRKGKDLFMPLRLALTGQNKGPEMASLIKLIGRDKILKRLKG